MLPQGAIARLIASFPQWNQLLVSVAIAESVLQIEHGNLVWGRVCLNTPIPSSPSLACAGFASPSSSSPSCSPTDLRLRWPRFLCKLLAHVARCRVYRRREYVYKEQYNKLGWKEAGTHAKQYFRTHFKGKQDLLYTIDSALWAMIGGETRWTRCTPF